MPSYPASNYSAAYGGIPQLPAYTVDYTSTIGEDPWAQILAKDPTVANALQSAVGNIRNNLAGYVSAPDLATFQQQSAERGVATGSPGSANTNAAYLRALGLTEMQLQQLGAQQLNQLMNAIPIQKSQSGAQADDLSAAQSIYNAAPVPSAAAAANRNALLSGIGGAGGRINNSLASLIPQSTRDMSWFYTHPQPPSGYSSSGTSTPTISAPISSRDNWIYDDYAGAWYNTATDQYDYEVGPVSSDYYNMGLSDVYPDELGNNMYNTYSKLIGGSEYSYDPEMDYWLDWGGY